MSERGDRIFNWIAACAVLIAIVAVTHRLRPDWFGQQPVPIRSAQEKVPVPVDDWTRYLEGGHRFGPADAPVTILEFADFECPACGFFTKTSLKYIQAKYPDDVAIVFRHWPLSYHKFGYPSARAAECAGAQGQFQQMHDLLFAKQDSLGLKSFESFAEESGVSDLAAFRTCNSSAEKIPSVEAGIEAAKAVGGTGTPVVVLNGLRLPGAVDSLRLEEFVKEALAAKR